MFVVAGITGIICGSLGVEILASLGTRSMSEESKTTKTALKALASLAAIAATGLLAYRLSAVCISLVEPHIVPLFLASCLAGGPIGAVGGTVILISALSVAVLVGIGTAVVATAPVHLAASTLAT